MTEQKKNICSNEQKDWHRMTNNTFKTYDFLGRLKPGEKKVLPIVLVNKLISD
jgi:hypothetical protein